VDRRTELSLKAWAKLVAQAGGALAKLAGSGALLADNIGNK